MAKSTNVKARPDGASKTSPADANDVLARDEKRSATFTIASLAGGLLLIGAIYALRLDRVAGLFVDDAWYVLLAKSLATGQGYQLMNSPTPGIPPIYPPGFPFLVSLAYRLWPDFPSNVILLKSVSVVAMLGVGWASYKHFTRDREWPHPLSLISALVVALTPGLVFLATSSVMSECVFTCVQLLAMLVIESGIRAEDGKSQLRHAAFGGALAALAFLTRSIGLTVVGAGFVYLLKERKWKPAAVFAGAALIVVAPWMLYSRAHRATPEQRSEQNGMIVQDYSATLWQRKAGDTSSGTIGVGGLPDRMWANAAKIAGNNIAVIFAPPLYRSPKLSGEETLEKGAETRVLSYLLTALLLLGFALTVRRRMAMAEFITAFTLLITLLWPWDTFRFLLPLMPFLLSYLLEAVRGIRDFAREKFETKAPLHPWRALLVVAGLILTIYVYDHAVYIAKRSDLSRAEYLPWRAIFDENLEALNWIREKSSEEAVVASLNPALVYLYTGRKTIASDNPATNWENWKRLNVRYMAYLSVYPVADPGMGEGRFNQAYRSKGPLKLRVMDLGNRENRLPWNPYSAPNTIKIENFK
ncbi:MAG TPA: glycosyltransferase family 39 protein [Blastocatellia bacterium]|nr:glycosyltransferase family 39 protein [Blastocatellia bacterium]HMX27786.1 glycosyltransferase family 39 protein [Blastocatellia bacterium]HMY72096.1 glycosyltransferase family 39 protein [Blastocatellia bacterium]HMZ18580.1 glycosyltransferase family 39 protein [Blastocatellia bacterium]HNG29083.1 glycosyltransferase family 39 protein [Blastocatellia bacterium]